MVIAAGRDAHTIHRPQFRWCFLDILWNNGLAVTEEIQSPPKKLSLHVTPDATAITVVL